MAARERPSSPAALPTDAARTTLRDRWSERARVVLQSAFLPEWGMRRAPLLVRDEVLYPQLIAPVTTAELYAAFHRAETIERAPLVIVVAPVPENVTPRFSDPPLVGTLARVRVEQPPGTDNDDDDPYDLYARLHVRGIHRVAVDGIPDGPRTLARAAPLRFSSDDEGALRSKLRAPFLAYLRDVIQGDEKDADLMLHLDPAYLAYFVAKTAQLPIETQDFILRIDNATELVDVALEMIAAMLEAVPVVDSNSTG